MGKRRRDGRRQGEGLQVADSASSLDLDTPGPRTRSAAAAAAAAAAASAAPQVEAQGSPLISTVSSA